MAQIEYNIAEKNLAVQVSKLKDDIELARIAVTHLNQKKKLIESRLELHTIRAPASGRVLYREISRGEKVARGVSVWMGADILEIPDLANMKVKLQISETRIGSIQCGKEVEVEIDSIPNTIFPGKITRISQQSQDKNERLVGVARQEQGPSDIRVFEVEVAILKQDLRLKLRLKAKVKIPVRKIPKVLWIPRKAIQLKKGTTHVYLSEKGKKKLIPVSIGEYDQNRCNH